MEAPPACILFDFDGVILASTDLKSGAFAAVYADEDPALVAQVVAYQDAHGGIGRREKFEYFEAELFGRSAEPERIRALCERFATIVDETMLKVEFVAGAEQALADCAGRVEMHLVSGMPDTELKTVVRRRGLERYFASIVGSPTAKYTAFQTILRDTGFTPEQCLAVGDSTTEYQAAAALGIPFLAIVPPGAENRFPAAVPVIVDMRGFAGQIGL